MAPPCQAAVQRPAGTATQYAMCLISRLLQVLLNGFETAVPHARRRYGRTPLGSTGIEAECVVLILLGGSCSEQAVPGRSGRDEDDASQIKGMHHERRVSEELCNLSTGGATANLIPSRRFLAVRLSILPTHPRSKIF